MTNNEIVKNMEIGSTVIIDSSIGGPPAHCTIVREKVSWNQWLIFKFPPYISARAASAVIAARRSGELRYGKGLKMYDVMGRPVPKIRLRDCGCAAAEGFMDTEDGVYRLNDRGRAVFSGHVPVVAELGADAAHVVRQTVADVTGGFQ